MALTNMPMLNFSSFVPLNITMLAASIFVGVGFALYILHLRRQRSRNPASLPLPPGPPRRLLIGNLLDIPRQWPWLKFERMRQQYGDLVYLEALGNRILVLNTLDCVNDLLDKRGLIYSDRPTFVMSGELMGLRESMPLLSYGDMWRKHRRLTNIALSTQAVKNYVQLQESVIIAYLRSLLEMPEAFVHQLRLTAGRIIMAVTYGLPVDTPDNLYITQAEHTMDMITQATVPGAFLVDLLPLLKYIPSWFPLASFQKFAEEGRRGILSMISRPYLHVKHQIAEGTAMPCFVVECLQNWRSGPEEKEEEIDRLVMWTAGAMYGGGGESTYATILAFMMALALYPEVQARAKAEIKTVVGTDRLPSLQDRPALPYIKATIKEALRWRPALPLGIARRTGKDDFYRGHFIPAGTIVLPNVWEIAKDETSGIPSSEFAPERFLPTSGTTELPPDPHDYAFGFGRRTCPGRTLGENSLFLLVSGIIATVTITMKMDDMGNPLPLRSEFTGGLVSYPLPYDINIQPDTNRTYEIVQKSGNINEGPSHFFPNE